MEYSRFLFCLSFVFITYISAGQVSTEQRAQQLKDSWYKNLHKLEELGNLIAEKNNLLTNLGANIISMSEDYTTEKAMEYGWLGNIKKMLEESNIQVKIDKFGKKLFHVIQDEVHVKNFIIHELYLKKDFLPIKDTWSCIDIIKFSFIQGMIEINGIKKLLDDYEELLQKMANIDKELVSLGYPRLLQC